MIIQLSKFATLNLKYKIRQHNSRFDSFAKLASVSKSVLSRQLKTGSIEYTFLVKYLIILGYLPESYQPFKSFNELFFLKTVPSKYRASIQYILRGELNA